MPWQLLRPAGVGAAPPARRAGLEARSPGLRFAPRESSSAGRRVDFGEEGGLPGRFEPGCLEGVAGKLDEVVAPEPEPRRDGDVVGIDVPPEVGGVVRVDGHEEAVVEHAPERVRADVGDDPELDVAERTHGQGHAPARQLADQVIVLEGRVPVVDSHHLEECERLQKSISRFESDLGRSEQKLGNENFVTKAPAAVVAKERDKAKDLAAKLETMREQLSRLRGTGTA